MKSVRTIIFLFTLFFSGALYAQESFLKAYYITTSNDTVRGFVSYRPESMLYKAMQFKNDLSSRYITIYPAEAKEVVFADRDHYESHFFIEKNGELLNAFFRVLLKGKLTLLHYNSRFFTIDQNDKLVEITKKAIAVGGGISQDYTGLGILNVLMDGCENTRMTNELEYQKAAPNYLRLFQQYHNCSGTPFRQSSRLIIPASANFGLLASASFSTMALSYKVGDGPAGSATTVRAGAFMSVFVPQLSDRLRVVLEATFSKQENYVYFSGTNVNNDLLFNAFTVHTPILLRYSIGAFFLDAGMENQFVFNQNHKWRQETRNADVITTRNLDFEPLSTWKMGFLAGGGVNFRMFGYPVRGFVRYSKVQYGDHNQAPSFSFLQSGLAIQLTK